MKNDPEKFVYWLQGFFELANPRVLDNIQVKIIKDHLALVFDKATPEYDRLNTKHTGLSSNGLCGTVDTKTTCLSGYSDPFLNMFDDPVDHKNFKYC